MRQISKELKDRLSTVLNQKITITIEEEQRVNGKPILKEVNFYSGYAAVLDLIGNELYQAINIKLENALIFKVRYCKLLEALREKEKYTVHWQGRKFSIYTVDYMGYSRDFIKIKCKEIL